MKVRNLTLVLTVLLASCEPPNEKSSELSETDVWTLIAEWRQVGQKCTETFDLKICTNRNKLYEKITQAGYCLENEAAAPAGAVWTKCSELAASTNDRQPAVSNENVGVAELGSMIDDHAKCVMLVGFLNMILNQTISPDHLDSYAFDGMSELQDLEQFHKSALLSTLGRIQDKTLQNNLLMRAERTQEQTRAEIEYAMSEDPEAAISEYGLMAMKDCKN